MLIARKLALTFWRAKLTAPNAPATQTTPLIKPRSATNTALNRRNAPNQGLTIRLKRNASHSTTHRLNVNRI
jgi:hypothetical protein